MPKRSQIAKNRFADCLDRTCSFLFNPTPKARRFAGLPPLAGSVSNELIAVFGYCPPMQYSFDAVRISSLPSTTAGQARVSSSSGFAPRTLYSGPACMT